MANHDLLKCIAPDGLTSYFIPARMSETRMSRLAFRCGLAFLAFSASLWIVTTICFIGVWDHVAALTTFPQWSWALIGILGLALAWRLMRRWGRWLLLLFALWTLATLVFADNLGPLLRGVIYESPRRGPAPNGALRIVTLNCASSASAAGEVMRFKLDIVLLQEAPVSNKVAQLAREWFGDSASFVAGLDCAIISRHPLKPLDERPPVHYTRAVLSLPDKRQLLVVSLRLTPPLGAMDLWRPATWRAYREDRRFRRLQLQSVLAAQAAPDLRVITAGILMRPRVTAFTGCCVDIAMPTTWPGAVGEVQRSTLCHSSARIRFGCGISKSSQPAQFARSIPTIGWS